MGRPTFLQIPCGQTLGHGEVCQDGHLCDQCGYIDSLEAENARLREALHMACPLIKVLAKDDGDCTKEDCRYEMFDICKDNK